METHSTFKITAICVLTSQTLTVLLKEEVVQQSSKHDPFPAVFKHVAGVKLEMGISHFSVSTLHNRSLCYFQLNMGFQCFALHILFLFTLYIFTQRASFFGNGAVQHVI